MIGRIFERQILHFVLLAVLLVIVYFVAQSQANIFEGSLWGISSFGWFMICVIIPIVHQIMVWLVWRTQLETQWITERYPNYGFRIYLVAFVLFLASRPVTAFILAYSNRGTLDFPPIILYSLAAVFTVLAAYLVYSVEKYFGVERASGADHFFAKYREMPMVKEGIFKYTSNGMYAIGFLLVWIPALLFASKAALLSAFFSHIYIWVHYYCLEKPDMDRIYGARETQSGTPQT